MKNNDNKNNWYVFTGGPSAGKTTTINELKKMGYHVEGEKAKQVLDEWMAKGMTLDEIRSDEYRFQTRVLPLKIEAEQTSPPDELIFFDRGIPDTVAYYRLAYGKYEDKLLDEALKKYCKYKKVFIFDLLPLEKSNFRNEDDAIAKKIEGLTEAAYKELGLEIVRVPVMSVEKRVEFVLGNL